MHHTEKVRWCIDVIKEGQKELEGEGAYVGANYLC